MERKKLRGRRPSLTGEEFPLSIGGMSTARIVQAVLPVVVGTLLSCGRDQTAAPAPFDAAFVRLSAGEIAALPLAVSFETPMGGEQGALVYNAQPFRTTRHLGDDLNGIGGWNSDLGDPVFAAGAGRVVYAGVPGPGWGNMIILAHRVPDADGIQVYQTVYAHLEQRLARLGQTVKRGQKIGRVGTADGRYLAHLHFEVRRSRSVYPGLGYADAPLDRVSPDAFVRSHQSPESALVPAP
jgi:hypothetical protein